MNRSVHRPATRAALIALLFLGVVVGATPGSAIPPVLDPPEGATAAKKTRTYESFSGNRLDSNKWTDYMTSKAADGWPWRFEESGTPEGYSAIGSPENSFNDEFFSPGNIKVSKGKLRLKLVPDTTYNGYHYRGAVATSYGKYEFKGGTLTVRAKMPDMTTGAWPAIWLLPGHTSGAVKDRNELDIFEGGFLPEGAGLPASTPANRVMVSTYHAGEWPNTTNYSKAIVGPDLSKGFHNYSVKYKPGVSIRTYLDGKLVAKFTENISADPYYLILNHSHADPSAKGWHTIGNPTKTRTMKVTSVTWRK